MKRIISLLCVFALFLYIFPFPVLADTVTIEYAGRCGESAYWKMTSDNVLTIYGTGATYDFNSNYKHPASGSYSAGYNWPGGATSVVVEEGITYLGDYLFKSQYYVVDVKLPNSLVGIGSSTFANFNKLLSIDLPGDVVTLGSSCFAGCDLLSNVIFPINLQSIHDYCFSGCPELSEVVLPSTLISVGSYVFSECTALKNVYVGASLPPSAGTGLFSGCPDSLQIYVPDPVAYESAPGWADYAAWIVGGVHSGANGPAFGENCPLYIEAPAGAATSAGVSISFAVRLVGTGDFDPSLKFALQGAESANTKYTATLQSGGHYVVQLSPSSYETASQLILTMVSVQDETIRKNYTVSISECPWSDSLEESEPTLPSVPQVDNSEVLSAIDDMQENIIADNSIDDELFNIGVSEQDKDFDENMGILDDMTLPTFSDIDTDFDDILNDDSGDGITLAAKFFKCVFDNELIYIVFFIAFMLALISYVIFGKR